MGDYVYGSGEVTLKKELSAVNFSQIQEGLKKKKDDLDMVELTFRIRLDATNKSSIMEINEGSDSWDEENTLEILAYLAPYITEGRFVYLYWTRRPSRSYAKAGMNRPAGVKTAHSCGHTSS